MTIANMNKIGPNDVLFGRGYRNDNNPGNIKFRDYCDSRREHYKQLGNKGRAKTKYCMIILQHIKSIGGRFLRFDEATKSWREAEDKDVLIRIAQYFGKPASKYNKIKLPSLPPPTHTSSKHRAGGIKSISAKDVLFGRGKKSNMNKGNSTK